MAFHSALPLASLFPGLGGVYYEGLSCCNLCVKCDVATQFLRGVRCKPVFFPLWIILTHIFLRHVSPSACFCEGTWYAPYTGRTHATPHRKVPRRESNPGPSSCEATASSIVPPCPLVNLFSVHFSITPKVHWVQWTDICNFFCNPKGHSVQWMFSVTWDLQMVLRALYEDPCEWLSSLSLLLLSFLLALTSTKPVSKLSALFVYPACLMFGEVRPQLKGVKHFLCDVNHLKMNSK